MRRKFVTWWYFHMANPKVRKGEKGGFKWLFRRFWLEISTLSGNFKARFTAAEHPYGYLIAGKEDDNIEGYCQMLYTVGMLLTTDQEFVNDVQKAVKAYEDRVAAKIEVADDAAEEEIALEGEKQLQERIETPRRYRRRGTNEA